MADETEPHGVKLLFLAREKRMRRVIGSVIFLLVALTAWAIWNYYG